MNFPQPFLDKYSRLLPKKDFDEFIAYCKKTLRKSIRVNTLKISVKDFQKITAEKGWELTPIPWCESGFWIDRENKEKPLGTSIEHFLGLFYIQEASSMIPPEVLNPQPGDRVLDMAAAPGSKTTQLATKMKNEGVIIANEPVVKRIKGLVSNLERLGTYSVVVNRKEGQFFEETTPNFFDKILLDAPCTGEGTVRKDQKALDNWSQENIEGMSKLQKQLIKSAFKALKPGGEMVYSTCTLAREENEEVVEYLLNEFPDNAKLIPIILLSSDVIRESQSSGNNGMLRIWPQQYDSEGFFVAKIKKQSKTEKVFKNSKNQKKQKHFSSKYKVLRNEEVDVLQEVLEERFGYKEQLTKQFKIHQKEGSVYLCPLQIKEIDEKIYLERKGMQIGEFLHKRSGITEFKIHHLGVTLLGDKFQKNVIELSEAEVRKYLKGENLTLSHPASSCHSCEGENLLSDGIIALKYRNTIFTKGLLNGKNIKNQIPRYLIW